MVISCPFCRILKIQIGDFSFPKKIVFLNWPSKKSLSVFQESQRNRKKGFEKRNFLN